DAVTDQASRRESSIVRSRVVRDSQKLPVGRDLSSSGSEVMRAITAKGTRMVKWNSVRKTRPTVSPMIRPIRFQTVQTRRNPLIVASFNDLSVPWRRAHLL